MFLVASFVVIDTENYDATSGEQVIVRDDACIDLKKKQKKCLGNIVNDLFILKLSKLWY